MRELLIEISAGALSVVLVALLWLRSRITYRVGRDFFRILLFNLTLRKIPLSTITRVSTRVRGPVERWPNTLWPSHRNLVIHHQGSRRPLVITPANRYVIKAELERVLGPQAEEDTSLLERQNLQPSTVQSDPDPARPTPS